MGKAGETVTLKPVAIADDGHTIILAKRAGAKGGFRVRIDAALLAQLEAASDLIKARKAEAVKTGVAPPPAVPLVRPQSRLSPKEIQALLRQGRSIADIARRAGVDEAWVGRFEGPILWERHGTVGRAQKASFYAQRRGESALPLGEAVKANLKRRGVKLADAEWDDAWDSVRHARKKVWIVSFVYEGRSGKQKATWEFDPASGKLTALDRMAATLGWVQKPARRKRTVASKKPA